MTKMAIILFCLLTFLIAYTWLGYPIILFVASKIVMKKKKRQFNAKYITVIITAQNEEEAIESRVKNLLESYYPYNKLEVIVASDGSTDRTEEIVCKINSEDSRVKIVREKGRGKSHAQNQTIPQARGEIVILTDAESLFRKDTLRELESNFHDPKIGCATGRLILKKSESGVSESHGFYWKYEDNLRRLESKVGVMHTATGTALAFRKKLFVGFDYEYGEDCILPLQIAKLGYRTVQDDHSLVIDEFPSSVKGEFKARIRMTARNLSCTLSVKQLLNPFRHPGYTFAIVSHKILRWFTPYFMLGVFALNCLLIFKGTFWQILFLFQVAYYAASIFGYYLESKGLKVFLVSQIFSFTLANIGFLLGTLYAIKGKKITKYTKDRVK